METQEPFYKDAVKELVRLLFIELCRHWSSAGPSSPLPSRQPEMVKQAILYLRDHLHESLSVDDLCGQVGFSKYYFCHVFKKVTGRTVMDYANSLRCSQARQLLESGAYSISECAVRCGFRIFRILQKFSSGKPVYCPRKCGSKRLPKTRKTRILKKMLDEYPVLCYNSIRSKNAGVVQW